MKWAPPSVTDRDKRTFEPIHRPSSAASNGSGHVGRASCSERVSPLARPKSVSSEPVAMRIKKSHEPKLTESLPNCVSDTRHAKGLPKTLFRGAKGDTGANV